MKPLLVILGIFISCQCSAQSDIDTIRAVFNYLNTVEFRRVCADSLRAKCENFLNDTAITRKTRKRLLKEEAEDISMILGNTCFEPYKNYWKNGNKIELDTLQLKMNSSRISTIRLFPVKNDSSGNISCRSKEFCFVYFWNISGTIIVEYFRRQKPMEWNEWEMPTTIQFNIVPGTGLEFAGYLSRVRH